MENSQILAEAVLTKSLAEADERYKRFGYVENSCRALGLACRFRGLEMVKTLVENGATFRYVRPEGQGGYFTIYYWLSPLEMTKALRTAYFINSDPCFGNSVSIQDAVGVSLRTLNGWLKQPRKRDEMIQYATELGTTECTAFLLEFKNRTADLVKEQASAEKKMLRELNADPNSVTELKKNWNFKRNDDGTLVITGYKGGGTVLNVPEKIGDGAVTEIGDWALSPHAPRIKEPTREFRKTITRITLPEGLKKIGESAFCDLISLESVNIPESVRSIGEYAFRDCVSLKTIIVPDGVKDIDANAFSMQHGRGALEYVRLPRTLGYFNEDCKRWRVYLFHAVNCPDLVVGVPRAPHVEEFCEHNKIKFEYYD